MTITKRYRKILLLTTPSLTELIEPVYEDVVLSNEDSLCSLDDTENIVLDIRLSPQDKTEPDFRLGHCVNQKRPTEFIIKLTEMMFSERGYSVVIDSSITSSTNKSDYLIIDFILSSEQIESKRFNRDLNDYFSLLLRYEEEYDY